MKKLGASFFRRFSEFAFQGARHAFPPKGPTPHSPPPPLHGAGWHTVRIWSRGRCGGWWWWWWRRRRRRRHHGRISTSTSTLQGLQGLQGWIHTSGLERIYLLFRYVYINIYIYIYNSIYIYTYIYIYMRYRPAPFSEENFSFQKRTWRPSAPYYTYVY